MFHPVFGHGFFRSKRTGTYTGGVSFQNADHMIQMMSRDACTDRTVGRNCGRAGGIWKNTVIDITHSAQLSFQYDSLAGCQRGRQIASGIADIRSKSFRLLSAPEQKCRERHRFLMITSGQFHIFGIQHHFQTGLNRFFLQMKQITKTQGFLAIFITVGVGNASSGRTEGRSTLCQTVFFQYILDSMPWHGDRSSGGQLQILRSDRDAFFPDLGDLTGQMFQIDDHAIPQNTNYIFM